MSSHFPGLVQAPQSKWRC